jgi:hypothetical protein
MMDGVGYSGYKNKADKLNKLWNDVISRPQDWIDNRPLKKTGSVSMLVIIHRMIEVPLERNTACMLY